jgi:hypothetical protein
MKKMYNLLLLVAVGTCFSADHALAQCPGGYTQAQLNWDNLDYYHNSGVNTAPYGFTGSNYITDAMEQNQRFAIGTTWVAIVTSSNALVQPGAISAENATHTGELANYTGEDVQYTPSANGQTITLTFGTPVSGPNFTLYDIDANANFTITATSNLGLPTTVNATGGSILTIGIIPLARTITANGTFLNNNVNDGSATITVPGLVSSITITISNRGSDANFWLSDINACVSGTFPTNWHQGANNRPFVGPTQNQPDYFLVTPDNNSCYYLDPVSAEARFLFTDTERDYINSFGYDPYNRFLYYITEDVTVDATNRQLKRYDYNTETSSVVIANLTTTLGIPTFNSGVESAGAAFYNGALYFGIEGGRFGSGGGTVTRETIVWKIEFDGSNNPTIAYQVFAANAYNNASNTSIHDWGDFIIKNGILYDFNTARNSTNYSQSKYHHYNMMTGAVTLYNNPGTTTWNGQAGMGWNGNLYYFRGISSTSSGVGTYDEAGNNGAITTISVLSGPLWTTGGAGDASDPFRPKCDFGDAPASYDPYADPATQSPAVHERADNIWIGSTTTEATSWDREYLKRGVNGTADTDNGLAFVPMMPQLAGTYITQVSVYNNSGSDATLIAWLDYNANGVFDASEAATLVPAGPIASSAAVQTRFLYWPGYTTPLVNGQSTYMRIRITSASAGMTSSHATGYFRNGEVEDYRVLVDNFPLTTHLQNFDASLVNKKVKLNWKASEDQGSYEYRVERSSDNNNWTTITNIAANGTNGTFSYEAEDPNPGKGVSYYRIRMVEAAGMNRVSAVKVITVKSLDINLSLAPNPASDRTMINMESPVAGDATVQLLNMQGSILLSTIKRVITGQNNIELSLPESLSAGSYLVRVSLNGEVVNKKLVVKK